MPTLTLLRHAKSSWDDPVTRDFDRPLNARGHRAAATMGRHLKAQGLQFDHVVASPAVRVTETLDQFHAGYGERLAPAWDRRIYLASAATLIDLVRELPASSASALMVWTRHWGRTTTDARQPPTGVPADGCVRTGQAEANVTLLRLRADRIDAPIAPKPTIISAQVDGSGIALVNAASKRAVPKLAK
jgi:hypothetical protein